MKAAYLSGIRSFTLREIPAPAIAHAHDVLVRIASVGVCGSDIHYFTGGRIGTQVVRFPFVIGHEASGVVERTGTEVTRVRPGDRVAIDPAVSCGMCDQCRGGREHTCRTLRFMGAPGQREGCLQEYLVADEQSCYVVPETMTSDQAVLCEPLSIGMYAVARSELPSRADVAILGVGPIGMCVFHALRAGRPVGVAVTDRIDARLAVAGDLHPDWAGNPGRDDVVAGVARIHPLMLDAVFECSGDVRAILQGIDLLKPGGKLVLVGIPESDAVAMPIHELRRKEISVLNIRRQSHCTQRAIDALSSGGISLDALVTHRFPLDATQDAFDLVARYGDGVMKAMIDLT